MKLSPRFSTRALLPIALSLALALLITDSARAGDNAGSCLSVRGTLFQKADDRDVQVLKPGESVKPGALLLSLFEAKLVSANKAVKIELYGDDGTHGSFPVQESAVRINENSSVDLDLTLERGTLVMINQKAEAKISLHVRGQNLALLLMGQGAKAALTLSGRHAPGASNIARDDPTSFVFLAILKGKAMAAGPNRRVALTAPPGPALVKWDSMDKVLEPVNIKELPPEPTAQDKAYFSKMCDAAAKLQGANPAQAALELTQSDDVNEELVGTTALGALDALPQLLKALNDPKHANVRRQAVLVLRHWLGREPGQIKRFQQILMEEKKLSATKVKNALSLVVGFDEGERRSPSTYAFLIECLQHKSIAVRELAHWHLVRLVPAGQQIPFDAALAPEQQQQAVAAWRTLIPSGQLPRQTKQ